MKFIVALIAAAACIAGVADAKGHKVGLKRIPQEDFSIVFSPLDDYLLEDRMHGAVEHLKQKYMGPGHESPYNNRVNQLAIDSTGRAGHGLPLTNFLNAQCTLSFITV
jgi:hypothetical protein